MAEPSGAIEVVIDGVSRRRLTGIELRTYSLSCVEAIGMTIIHGPISRRMKQGWHCHTIIAESHLTVETVGFDVHIDIFSCNPFSMQEPRDLAIHLLGMREGMHIQKIQRAGPGSPG